MVITDAWREISVKFAADIFPSATVEQLTSKKIEKCLRSVVQKLCRTAIFTRLQIPKWNEMSRLQNQIFGKPLFGIGSVSNLDWHQAYPYEADGLCLSVIYKQHTTAVRRLVLF